MEGSGEEIAQYARSHPERRFRLSVVEEAPMERPQRGLGSESWEEVMEFIHSLKGKMGSLPLEATSTEALYD